MDALSIASGGSDPSSTDVSNVVVVAIPPRTFPPFDWRTSDPSKRGVDASSDDSGIDSVLLALSTRAVVMLC